MDFAVSGPLVRRSRLLFGFCPSTRTFAWCFLQTPLAAVALAPSLALHLHQVGRRTFTSELLSMPSTPRNRCAIARWRGSLPARTGILARTANGDTTSASSGDLSDEPRAIGAVTIILTSRSKQFRLAKSRFAEVLKDRFTRWCSKTVMPKTVVGLIAQELSHVTFLPRLTLWNHMRGKGTFPYLCNTRAVTPKLCISSTPTRVEKHPALKSPTAAKSP